MKLPHNHLEIRTLYFTFFPTLFLVFTSLQFLLPLLSSLSTFQTLVISLSMVQVHLTSSLLKRTRPTLQPAVRMRLLLLRNKPSPLSSTFSMMLRPTPSMSKSVKSHPDQTYSQNVQSSSPTSTTPHKIIYHKLTNYPQDNARG